MTKYSIWLPIIGLGVLACIWRCNWVAMENALVFCGLTILSGMGIISARKSL